MLQGPGLGRWDPGVGAGGSVGSVLGIEFIPQIPDECIILFKISRLNGALKGYAGKALRIPECCKSNTGNASGYGYAGKATPRECPHSNTGNTLWNGYTGKARTTFKKVIPNAGKIVLKRYTRKFFAPSKNMPRQEVRNIFWYGYTDKVRAIL